MRKERDGIEPVRCEERGGLVDFGAASGLTRGRFLAGVDADGPRVLDPHSNVWVRLKSTPYPPLVD